MNNDFIDIVARTLMHPRMLGRIFVIWIVITSISTAVSISFVTNTASIAAENTDIVLNSPLPHAQEQGAFQAPQAQTQTLESTPVANVLPTRLIISELDIDVPVSNPVSTDIAVLDEELLSSVVRYPTSGTLGARNQNMLIFGHSSRVPTYRGFYRAFNDIETLEVGAVITLVSGNTEYIYRVSDVRHVSATDAQISIGAKNSKLTLVTCNGFGKKSDRWVVESDFIGSYTL